jgi:hypothetical protein
VYDDPCVSIAPPPDLPGLKLNVCLGVDCAYLFGLDGERILARARMQLILAIAKNKNNRPLFGTKWTVYRP